MVGSTRISRLSARGAKGATVAAFLALALAWTGEARAVALFDGESHTTLTITGFFDEIGGAIAKPTGLSLVGSSAIVDDFTDSFGDAGASTSAFFTVIPPFPADMDVGDSVSQDITADGFAATGDSFAGAVINTDGYIDIHNGTAGLLEIAFELTYDYDLLATADSPEKEFSFIDMFIDVLLVNDLEDEGDDTFIFSTDDFAESDFFTTASDSDSFSFSLFFAPGEGNRLAVFNDLEGYAEHIPEPAALALFGAGLAGFGWLRRRRAV